jgi:geranylgeranyl diphosphate synthase type I
MAVSHVGLPAIRAQVGRALDEFLRGRRGALGSIGPELAPWMDAITALLAGGKRLRPAFCYWGWRSAGGEDDLIDASDTRRGQPSVHRRFAAAHAEGGWSGSSTAFGAGAAVLIGDLLLAWTDELFRASSLPEAALRRGQQVLDAMRAELVCGQYLDLLGQAAGDGTVGSALRVVRYKSAKYTVERPLQLGTALAAPADGACPALEQTWAGYGMPVGVAFQLRDDVLGVFGDPAQTGKPTSDDLREGKRTVLVAIARERASTAQREVLDRRVGDPLLDEAGAAEVRSVLTETGALAACEVMIDGSVAEALAALDGAPVTGEARLALAELAVIATARSD